MNAIRFTLNGRPTEANAADAHMTVLHWLRREGLTGSKEGCAEGECGACAVALRTRDADGRARYESVNGCLLLVGQLAGREVITVEGVAAGGELHPVQRAMVREGGSQCGYCTPGFVVSMFAEYYRPGRAEYDPEAIGGNLCRCTGYRPIRDAMRSLPLAPPESDLHLGRLAAPSTPLAPISTEAEGRAFHRPVRLPELWPLLAANPEAVLVAGGTDVVVEMNQRHRRAPVIIALDGISELEGIVWGTDHVRIGAGVTLRALEERVHGKLPLVSELLPLFSSRLIRSRATLGGNLANGSPIGDSPPVLLALGADVVLVSARGERRVPVDAFFTGYRKTALERGEIVVAVVIPLPHPAHARFYKVSKRVYDDISTVAAAFAVDLEPSGVMRSVRVGLGGVAATPVRAREAEALLAGQPFSAARWAEAGERTAAAIAPMDDHRGSAAYRRAMVRELFARFGREAGNGNG